MSNTLRTLMASAYDVEGGAAKAAYRLHRGFRSLGLSSQMIVQIKTGDDETVISPTSKLGKSWARIRPTLEFLPMQFQPGWNEKKTGLFSMQWIPLSLPTSSSVLPYDVVNLHWIGDGFIAVEALQAFHKPIVWTLHDMWAFTGGCHYSYGCSSYEKSCGTCPQLTSQKKDDLSHWIWERKSKAWKNLDMTIVTPSHWLAECVKQSSLFQERRVEVIHNGIDLGVYKPVDRKLARQILNLPQDQNLILFGAMKATQDLRKGFHLLCPALELLSQQGWTDKAELVIIGSSQPSNPIQLPFPSHWLGRLNDDVALALVYAAADVFVAPSTQDNLPNTLVESLACGTPAVGFKIGGIPDIIDHELNGYLAQPFEIEDLAKGIHWVLEDPARHTQLEFESRLKAERSFCQTRQAQQYQSLFREVTQKDRS